MDLHHHAVVARHARHLGQHLGAEQLGVTGLALAAQQAIEQRLAIGGGEIGGLAVGVTVIGRGRAMGAEEGATRFVRIEIALPVRISSPAIAPKRSTIGDEIFAVGIDDIIGTIGGDDPAGSSHAARMA